MAMQQLGFSELFAKLVQFVQHGEEISGRVRVGGNTFLKGTHFRTPTNEKLKYVACPRHDIRIRDMTAG
jgi:hypothetical protein